MAEQMQTAPTLEEDATQRSAAKRPWLFALMALLPLVVIMGFFSTQTYLQSGIPVFLADWQFGRFGQSLPIFNIAIFVVLAIIIGLLVDFLIGLARRRKVEDEPVDVTEDQVAARRREAQADTTSAQRSADRFARLLSYIGGAVVAMALFILFWALMLPRGAETVTFGGSAAAQAGRVIQGTPDGRLMVTTVQDILVYRDSAFFVPIVDPAEPRTIRRFVEFVPDGRWNGAAVPQVDVSQPFQAYRLALPAFTPTLYAGNGYTVVKPYEVLTNRPISVQLPYYITAIQLALIGLVILGGAWIQRRHARRLRDRADDAALQASAVNV